MAPTANVGANLRAEASGTRDMTGGLQPLIMPP